jgi:hypothetical protein
LCLCERFCVRKPALPGEARAARRSLSYQKRLLRAVTHEL